MGSLKPLNYNALTSKHHHPYGMMMPDRDWSSESGYRFGFNGKEIDPEKVGSGGSTYDYGFRIYNPALARFLSVDPISSAFPWFTPYQYASNCPVSFIDIDGLEGIQITNTWESDLRQQILVKQDFNIIEDLPLGTFIATEYPDASSVIEHTYKRTIAPTPSSHFTKQKEYNQISGRGAFTNKQNLPNEIEITIEGMRSFIDERIKEDFNMDATVTNLKRDFEFAEAQFLIVETKTQCKEYKDDLTESLFVTMSEFDVDLASLIIETATTLNVSVEFIVLDQPGTNSLIYTNEKGLDIMVMISLRATTTYIENTSFEIKSIEIISTGETIADEK